MSVGAIKEKLHEVRATLYEWLRDVADYPVVFAESSDPRPSEPHLVFKLFPSLVRIGGRDEHRPATEAGGSYTIISHRMMTVTITAAGWPVGQGDELDDKVEATHILTEVQLSLERPTVLESLQAIDLSVLSEGDIIDVSAVQETETEPRAVLDIILGIRFDVTDDPGIIEKVKISGALDSTFDGNFDRVIPEFEVSI